METKEILTTGSFEALKEYSEKNVENYSELLLEIEHRANKAGALGKELEITKALAKKASEDEKVIRKELNSMKDHTAKMVEVITESQFFSPKYEELPNEFSSFQKLKEVTSFDSNSKEWLEARFNTIGGSDVGVLVINEFSDELKYWDKSALKRVVESKTIPVTDADVKTKDYSMEERKGGPLYRGTVWEDLIRDKFAREYPNYKVYNSKKQYARTDRPFQQVNFDGLLSDCESNEPNGILELKTGTYEKDWAEGIPLNYRAQVLYYLNASNFDYAIIGVLINDDKLICYKLHKDDAVAPGKYEKNMESYINEKLLPWWKEIKNS